MRKVLLIGVGAGDPELITQQAVRALNAVDVFFLVDKGEVKDDLVEVRRAICRRYIAGVEGVDYRFFEIPEPPRDRHEPSQCGTEDEGRARQQTP